MNTIVLMTGHIKYLTLQILVDNLFTTFKSKANSTFCTPSLFVSQSRELLFLYTALNIWVL
jgi:hypothetical protein